MNIVMLANTPCVFDARIRREAEALVEAGHRASVLVTSADGVADHETINGVSYRRIYKVREIKKSLEADVHKASAVARWQKYLWSLAFKAGRRIIIPSIRHLIGYACAYRKATTARASPS